MNECPRSTGSERRLAAQLQAAAKADPMANADKASLQHFGAPSAAVRWGLTLNR